MVRKKLKKSIDMKIEGFIWYTDIVEKLEKKHRVTIEEVESLFGGKPFFSKIEKGHVLGENLYRALGRSNSERYLTVFFIYKTTREALVISARDMSSRERRYYGKRKK
jgi:uncharacterized DUF497 family protein